MPAVHRVIHKSLAITVSNRLFWLSLVDIRDKVVPVYFSSLETLKTLFTELLPDIGNDVAY